MEDKYSVNIILFGPPGAGKGTQANKIVKKFNLYKISSGDLKFDTGEKLFYTRCPDLSGQTNSKFTYYKCKNAPKPSKNRW